MKSKNWLKFAVLPLLALFWAGGSGALAAEEKDPLSSFVEVDTSLGPFSNFPSKALPANTKDQFEKELLERAGKEWGKLSQAGWKSPQSSGNKELENGFKLRQKSLLENKESGISDYEELCRPATGADLTKSVNWGEVDRFVCVGRVTAEGKFVQFRQITLAKDGQSLLEAYVFVIYKYLASIVGIAAVAIIVFAGLQMTTSSSNQEAFSGAKDKIVAALAGILLLLLSGVVLYSVNPNFFKSPTLEEIQK